MELHVNPNGCNTLFALAFGGATAKSVEKEAAK